MTPQELADAIMECADCTPVAATSPGGFAAIAIRYCQPHRDESARQLQAARDANPEIDAIHRMLDAARSAR